MGRAAFALGITLTAALSQAAAASFDAYAASIARHGSLSPAILVRMKPPPPHRPMIFVGKLDPVKISYDEFGIALSTKDGADETVLYTDIWRIRRANGVGEPRGSIVIDYRNIRLFAAADLEVTARAVAKAARLAKYTSPDSEAVYIAADKITETMAAIPALHSPKSRAVISTDFGIQQVQESPDAAKRIATEARIAS